MEQPIKDKYLKFYVYEYNNVIKGFVLSYTNQECLINVLGWFWALGSHAKGEAKNENYVGGGPSKYMSEG